MDIIQTEVLTVTNQISLAIKKGKFEAMVDLSR